MISLDTRPRALASLCKATSAAAAAAAAAAADANWKGTHSIFRATLLIMLKTHNFKKILRLTGLIKYVGVFLLKLSDFFNVE